MCDSSHLSSNYILVSDINMTKSKFPIVPRPGKSPVRVRGQNQPGSGSELDSNTNKMKTKDTNEITTKDPNPNKDGPTSLNQDRDETQVSTAPTKTDGIPDDSKRKKDAMDLYTNKEKLGGMQKKNKANYTTCYIYIVILVLGALIGVFSTRMYLGNGETKRADVAEKRADVAEKRAGFETKRADVAENTAGWGFGHYLNAVNMADAAESNASTCLQWANNETKRADVAEKRADVAEKRAGVETKRADVAENTAGWGFGHYLNAQWANNETKRAHDEKNKVALSKLSTELDQSESMEHVLKYVDGNLSALLSMLNIIKSAKVDGSQLVDALRQFPVVSPAVLNLAKESSVSIDTQKLMWQASTKKITLGGDINLLSTLQKVNNIALNVLEVKTQLPIKKCMKQCENAIDRLSQCLEQGTLPEVPDTYKDNKISLPEYNALDVQGKVKVIANGSLDEENVPAVAREVVKGLQKADPKSTEICFYTWCINPMALIPFLQSAQNNNMVRLLPLVAFGGVLWRRQIKKTKEILDYFDRNAMGENALTQKTHRVFDSLENDKRGVDASAVNYQDLSNEFLTLIVHSTEIGHVKRGTKEILTRFGIR